LFAVFLRFRNQEVELAAACVPIQLRIPAEDCVLTGAATAALRERRHA